MALLRSRILQQNIKRMNVDRPTQNRRSLSNGKLLELKAPALRIIDTTKDGAPTASSVSSYRCSYTVLLK